MKLLYQFPQIGYKVNVLIVFCRLQQWRSVRSMAKKCDRTSQAKFHNIRRSLPELGFLVPASMIKLRLTTVGLCFGKMPLCMPAEDDSVVQGIAVLISLCLTWGLHSDSECCQVLFPVVQHHKATAIT